MTTPSSEFLFKDLTKIENISGGSGAETWVLKDLDGQLFVRKFGAGKIGDKLKLQTNWLIKNKNKLNCPQLLNEGNLDSYYYYDMSYLTPSKTLFMALADNPTPSLINSALQSLENFNNLNTCQSGTRNISDRNSYLKEKFFKNLELMNILDPVFSNYFNSDKLIIQNKIYLGLKPLLENENIKRTFEMILNEELQTAGHGDLTLSNVLIADDQIYFIDPNPTFKFISRHQEYSKILQSTVVQYELFNKIKIENDFICSDKINYVMTESINFNAINKSIMTSNIFLDLNKNLLLAHLAIHLVRILPYIKSNNKILTYVYFAETIKILNSIADNEYDLLGLAHK